MCLRNAFSSWESNRQPNLFITCLKNTNNLSVEEIKIVFYQKVHVAYHIAGKQFKLMLGMVYLVW